MKQCVRAVILLLFFFTNMAFAVAAEPVHFSKLLPFLPDKVEGFVAEKASGTTNTTMGMKTTEVSRLYRISSTDGDQTVSLKISDGTGNAIFIFSQNALPDFSNESTEGYEKSYLLDGYRAHERYTAESKNGSLSIFVSGRYLVSIDVNGFDSQTMQEWWKKIDVKKLEGLTMP